jgi:hypothetical protein
LTTLKQAAADKYAVKELRQKGRQARLVQGQHHSIELLSRDKIQPPQRVFVVSGPIYQNWEAEGVDLKQVDLIGYVLTKDGEPIEFRLVPVRFVRAAGTTDLCKQDEYVAGLVQRLREQT